MAVSGRIPRTSSTKTTKYSKVRRPRRCHAAIAAAMSALIVVNVIKGVAFSTAAGTAAEEKKVAPATKVAVPAAVETEETIVLSDYDNSSSSSHGIISARARQLHQTDVTVAGERCNPSSLWNRVVNPASYEFGCVEIKSMLAGEKTLVGHGRVRDVWMLDYDGRTVVVKTLRDVGEGAKSQKGHFYKHMKEVLILDMLKGHPNIVGMLGVCGTAVVTEYYSTDFLEVISRHGEGLPIEVVVSMALDAARGLQALHEIAHSIHVDLKPRQLFVGDGGRVVLNDFNSAKVTSTSPSTGMPCPARSSKRNKLAAWPSPENYAGQPLMFSADVYSMGMIFYALIAGRLPFTKQGVQLVRMGTARPEMAPWWHKGYTQVIQDMWAHEPEKRPSAGEVVERLEHILEELGATPSFSLGNQTRDQQRYT